MRAPHFRAIWSRFGESRALSADLSRATRSTVAFMLPLIFVPRLGWPLSATFVALGAQSISTMDVRGAYSVRVGLLLVVSLVLSGYAAMGALVSAHVAVAVCTTIALTLVAGIWRHLSSDYGASVLISSMLMFFLGLVGPQGAHTAQLYATSLAAGCTFAILLHVLFWPIRPQQPLRHAVAESWLAAGNLFAALAPVPLAEREARHDKIVQTETSLRATIDKSALLIIQASGKKPPHILTQLEALNLCAARLSLAIDTFNAALEGCLSLEDWERIPPTFDPVLTTLTNTARTIALAVVSRNPGHLATARIRLRRAEGLLRVFAIRMQNETSLNAYHQQLVDIVSEISRQLPTVIATLDSTIERADERSAFTSELFNLDTWMLRPLAATLNLGQRPDGALIRYILRLTLLTSAGVWAYQYFQLPHGYWLPFTMVVILQPDFGATRQRAAHRVAGTITGSIVATGLIWLHLPTWSNLTLIAIAAFGYAYIVRRNYGVAIFFVTIFVVILLEGGSGGHAHIAIERVLATCAGTALAFVAALIFWPKWERDRFPDTLAEAFRANADYLRHLAPTSAETTPDAVEKANRAVERAHAAVFASLRRMFGDPQNRREGIEQMAALANGSQRLTRVLNVVFAHFQPTSGAHLAEIDVFCVAGQKFLLELADEMTRRRIQPEVLTTLARAVEAAVPKSQRSDHADADSRWLFFQCGRAATELSALVVIAQGDLQIRPREQNAGTHFPAPASA